MNGGATTTWVARAIVEAGLSPTVVTSAVNLAYDWPEYTAFKWHRLAAPCVRPTAKPWTRLC